ncbi:MAG: hypothetical protein V4574_19905 [Pseudomonadota bacterium]
MAAKQGLVAAVRGRGARARIANYFWAMHAISAEDAVRYTPQRADEQAQFEQLRAAGIVREARRGEYWIDRDGFRAAEDKLSRAVAPWMVILCLLIGAALTLFYQG